MLSWMSILQQAHSPREPRGRALHFVLFHIAK